MFHSGAAGGNFAAKVATSGTSARSNPETLSDTDSDEDRLSKLQRSAGHIRTVDWRRVPVDCSLRKGGSPSTRSSGAAVA